MEIARKHTLKRADRPILLSSWFSAVL